MIAPVDTTDLDYLVGIPWVENGRDPSKGLDCWGLAMAYERTADIYLPDPFNTTDPDPETYSGRIVQWRPCTQPLQRLDLVFMVPQENGGPLHVGVVVSKFWVLHTSLMSSSELVSLRAVLAFKESVYRPEL